MLINMMTNDTTKVCTQSIIENDVQINTGNIIIDSEVASELFNISPEYGSILVEANGDKIKLYGLSKSKTEIPVIYKDKESELMIKDWTAVAKNINILKTKPNNLYTGESLELLTYDTEESGNDYPIKLTFIKTDMKGLYKLKSETKDYTAYSYGWLDNDFANDLIKQKAIISTEKITNDYGAAFLSSLK